MFRLLVAACFLLTLPILANVALAQDFSADVVSRDSDSSGMKKVYVTRNKARFELQGDNPQMGPSAIVFDDTKHSYTIIMAERHMYMDAPMTITKRLLTHFWRVDDPNDACPEWKKTAEEAGSDEDWGSCTKIGSDTLNGRDAVKYEGVSKKGEKSHIWVDSKLRCVVKTDEGAGGFELRNIQEGSQPASLFEIPSGYTKFDMGSMMRQQQ